jgi:hypothetical protein
LRHDREHKASLYQFSKRLCAILKQSLISFIHRFANLSAGGPAKACQALNLYFANSIMPASLPESLLVRV